MTVMMMTAIGSGDGGSEIFDDDGTDEDGGNNFDVMLNVLIVQNT